MMAITKNMNKSIRCTPLTQQNQMHNFAIGTVGKSRSRRGGVIKVNPPSLARRTFKVPGKGPAPLGRPMMNRAGQTRRLSPIMKIFLQNPTKSSGHSSRNPITWPKLLKVMKVPQTDIRNSSLFQSHMEKNHTFAIFFELLDNNKCTIVRNLAIFTEAFVSSRCFLTSLEDSLSHKQTHTDTSTQPPQHY